MKKIIVINVLFFTLYASPSDKSLDLDYERKEVADYITKEISKGMNPSKFSNSWFNSNWLNRLYDCYDLAKKNKNYDRKMQDCIDMFKKIEEHIGTDDNVASKNTLSAIKKFNALYEQKKEAYVENERELRIKSEKNRRKENFHQVRAYIRQNELFTFNYSLMSECEDLLDQETKSNKVRSLNEKKSLKSDCWKLLEALTEHRVAKNNGIREKIFGDDTLDTLNEVKNNFGGSLVIKEYQRDFTKEYWSFLEKNEEDFKSYRGKREHMAYLKAEEKKPLEERWAYLKIKCENILLEKKVTELETVDIDRCRNFLNNTASLIEHNQGYGDYWLGRKKKSLEYVQTLLETVDHKERTLFVEKIKAVVNPKKVKN